MAIALEDRFACRSVRSGYSILLLKPDDALDFVEAARREAKPILGIDAFIMTATTVQPLLEHGVDYSIGSVSNPGSWSEAKQFIEQRRELGLVFEVVI